MTEFPSRQGGIADGLPVVAGVDAEGLATISPYITEHIRRVGDYVLDLIPPDADPVTYLELQPGLLLSPGL